jgi:hypothetical protein
MSNTDPIKKPGVNLGAHEYMDIYWTCFPLLFVILFKTNAECPIFLFIGALSTVTYSWGIGALSTVTYSWGIGALVLMVYGHILLGDRSISFPGG